MKDRLPKTLLYVVTDVIILNLSLLVAMTLWYGGSIPGSHTTEIPPGVWGWYWHIAIVASVLCVVVYALFKMYTNLWRYASIDEVFKIFVATTVIFVALYVYHMIFLNNYSNVVLSRRLLFLAWMINTILFAFSRFGYRALRRFFTLVGHIMTSKAGCRRVMIIGAGQNGYNVIREMRSSKIRDSVPVIVLDPNPSKNNTNLLGVRVIADVERISDCVEKFQIDEIVIAMPRADRAMLKEIIDRCALTDCALKIVQPASDISDGNFSVNALRDVSISDLLFREEIKLDTKNISEYLSNRTVLVTGGGGSIGSELCRQIAKFGPKALVIFDVYENNAFQLMNELKAAYKDNINVYIRIGSVCDVKRLEAVCGEFRPQVVFHAAAHKHVLLMEDCPSEAVKNNIFGTLNTAQAADRFGVERFVLLSSDKAVNPSNVMGATKRVCERIVQNMAGKSKTKFMTVRFGNVLGSNGSVIPTFQQQIANGGPVTVNHPDIERFFMTIPEACRLVLQAASLGKTGRLFVLDMGQPVKILELAKNLIKLSGLKPDKDIEIVFNGLRPGDKMFEELILDEEKDGQVTYSKKVFMAKPVPMDSEVFEKQLEKLRALADDESPETEAVLREIVPNFKK